MLITLTLNVASAGIFIVGRENMNKKFLLCVVLTVLIISFCFSKEKVPIQGGSLFSIALTPGVEIPIGSNSAYYEIGGSFALRGEFTPSQIPFFSFLGEAVYSMNPYGPERYFSSLSGGGGAGLNFNLGERLKFQGFATGGYSFCKLDLAEQSITGGGTYISAGLEGNFNFNPIVAMGLNISYRNILGVYSGLSASIGASLNFRINKKSIPANMGPVEGNFLELLELSFERVFPVFYSYYDEHSMGNAVLYNSQKKAVSDITVSFFVNKYMDAPKECMSISELPAGESSKIDFKALFTENMLEITEGMKVATEIIIDYRYGGNRYRDSHTASMQIEFRNAMTWDDDRKAAAFVTAKDPDILRTSKNVAGMLKEVGEYNVHPNLLLAMAFHETLRLYGMTYVIDPSSSYEDLAKNNLRVDYLQFPRETMEYRAGDCDDLAILYSALFESVGIETAFITVPGHIYMAFSLGLTPEEGRKRFAKVDDLIFFNENTWIPIEITSLEEDFLKAWQLGAKQWREHSSRMQAGFFPIHEAWKVYRPIGLPGRGIQLSLPTADMVIPKLVTLVETFVEREIFPQVAQLESKIRETDKSQQARYMNKLGILYARYGLEEKALQEFNKVLLLEEYLPALINIGNIYFLEGAMAEALPYYEKALQKEPNNKKALLCVARVNHELENYSVVNEMYTTLQGIDAVLAEKFAYLDLRGEEGSRASSINSRQETVLWDEE